MVAFTTLQQRDTDLIRKALDGAVLIAPSTADLPATLTSGASGELAALPTGYIDVGWVDKGDGISRGRSVDSDEVTSLGSATPTRRDITSVDTTIVFTMQETKRISLELYHGVVIATDSFDATSKEVSFTEATRPATVFYRCLTIWTDLTGTDAIYGASLYPRVSVTDMDDVTLTDGGGAVTWKVTLTAYVDSDAGYAVKHMYGGPGWATRLTSMGWS